MRYCRRLLRESIRFVIKCIEKLTRVFFAECNFFGIYRVRIYYIIIYRFLSFDWNFFSKKEAAHWFHSSVQILEIFKLWYKRIDKKRNDSCMQNEYPNFFAIAFPLLPSLPKPRMRINRDLIDRGPRPVTLPNIPKTNVWSIQQSENEA